MKPVKLEFKGINSFSEHTIIDFDALTKGGLFGIFGDTGSGKSTILDAINFALYGDVERSKEKTDIINNNCDCAYVKFVFNLLNGGKRTAYTIERTLKRTGTHQVKLYEGDGESICVADKARQVDEKITEILGVDADDFRKCIALPQGEFSQFVKSAPSARLALIERLFNLSKYGDRLKAKLNERQTAVECEFQNISGRLQAYDGVTKEALKEKTALKKDKEKLLGKLRKSLACAEEKYGNLQILAEKKKELDEVNSSLEEYLKRSGDIARLKDNLSILDSCKEAVACDNEAVKKQAEEENLKADVSRLEKVIGADICRIEELERKIKEGNFEEKISRLTVTNALCLSSAGKVKELAEIKCGLEAKRSAFRSAEDEINKLSAELEKQKKQYAELEKNYKSVSENDMERLINVEFKGAVLKGEYARNLEYFTSFASGIRVYEDDSPLYKYAYIKTKEKIDEYKQNLTALKDVANSDVEAKLEKLKEVEKIKEDLRQRLTGLGGEIRNLEAEIKIKRSALCAEEKEGKNLRARFDGLKTELSSVFGEGCNDYNSAINENVAELEKTKRERDKLTSELEAVNARLVNGKLSLEKLKTLLCTASEQKCEAQKKALSLIADKGLENIDKCRSIALKFEGADGGKTVADYEAGLASLKERKSALEKFGGVDGVSLDALKSVAKEKEALSEDVAKLTGEIAVLSSSVEDITRRLGERDELKRQYDCVEKERNLVSALKEITKGNKFLEFIAGEYLTEISSAASATLLKLTAGRYFLTYKDNNFSVGDNFDCGNLRGVNTLSGGETFLVSLSLALALSQTICARSMKSIEFFFLDEGFGTLDTTLLDTVMNALERLKSSSFTIGVISHVEELKYRISNKITVNKATETHGSTVSVSC